MATETYGVNGSGHRSEPIEYSSATPDQKIGQISADAGKFIVILYRDFLHRSELTQSKGHAYHRRDINQIADGEPNE
jgi:hypothetical protein